MSADSNGLRTSFLFFFDYDLDGWLDLFQANGHVEDEINLVQTSQRYAQPAQIFWNCHCSRGFVTVAPQALGDPAGPAVGRGAAYADVDRDGDLDLIVTQVGRAAHLFRNEQQLGHHWLRLRLRGTGMNTDAIGARVRVRTDAGVQERTVMPSRSYLSQVERPLTFGLGTATAVEHRDPLARRDDRDAVWRARRCGARDSARERMGLPDNSTGIEQSSALLFLVNSRPRGRAQSRFSTSAPP